LSDHPLWIPLAAGGTVAIRWARYADGRCHAKDYYDATKECRTSLAALAQQVANRGYVGKQPENGHRLKGEYSELYELKPGDHRFMGFRFGRDFYLTNGAPKDDKKQEKDYAFSLKIRAAVLKDLKRRNESK
jgi:hypothetical protein